MWLFLFYMLMYFLFIYSYNYILMNVTDLMEMDYMFTKVMLYMSPHKDLYVVLQKVDPIMATSFYIWYIETYEKELLTKGNKDLVTVHKQCSFWVDNYFYFKI